MPRTDGESLVGSIYQNYDLLLQYALTIRGEVYLQVSHCLIAPLGTYFEDIRRVYSHPIALDQCQEFFRRNPSLETVSTYDTAGSVQNLVTQREPGAAAIAGKAAARYYGAKVMVEGLEDDPANYTRFFLLTLEDSDLEGLERRFAPDQVGPTKTSVVFYVENAPGSLHETLGEFASRRLDLTRSNPARCAAGPSSTCSTWTSSARRTRRQARRRSRSLLSAGGFARILGTYPSGRLDWVGSGEPLLPRVRPPESRPSGRLGIRPGLLDNEPEAPAPRPVAARRDAVAFGPGEGRLRAELLEADHAAIGAMDHARVDGRLADRRVARIDVRPHTLPPRPPAVHDIRTMLDRCRDARRHRAPVALELVDDRARSRGPRPQAHRESGSSNPTPDTSCWRCRCGRSPRRPGTRGHLDDDRAARLRAQLAHVDRGHADRRVRRVGAGPQIVPLTVPPPGQTATNVAPVGIVCSTWIPARVVVQSAAIVSAGAASCARRSMAMRLSARTKIAVRMIVVSRMEFRIGGWSLRCLQRRQAEPQVVSRRGAGERYPLTAVKLHQAQRVRGILFGVLARRAGSVIPIGHARSERRLPVLRCQARPRQLPAVVARLGAEVTVVEPEQRLPVDLAEDDEPANTGSSPRGPAPA